MVGGFVRLESIVFSSGSILEDVAEHHTLTCRLLHSTHPFLLFRWPRRCIVGVRLPVVSVGIFWTDVSVSELGRPSPGFLFSESIVTQSIDSEQEHVKLAMGYQEKEYRGSKVKFTTRYEGL
jgi:hypothetical protein